MEVIEALKTIKKHCKNRCKCDDCKIYHWCCSNLSMSVPRDWEIEEDK